MTDQSLVQRRDELVIASVGAASNVKECIDDELAEVRCQIVQMYRTGFRSSTPDEVAATTPICQASDRWKRFGTIC